MTIHLLFVTITIERRT
ncbi:YrzI family small protein [Geobacillus sp. FSL W8-0032]|nr:YrzI family small protein [Geobacillus icigianus]